MAADCHFIAIFCTKFYRNLNICFVWLLPRSKSVLASIAMDQLWFRKTFTLYVGKVFEFSLRIVSTSFQHSSKGINISEKWKPHKISISNGCYIFEWSFPTFKVFRVFQGISRNLKGSQRISRELLGMNWISFQEISMDLNDFKECEIIL